MVKKEIKQFIITQMKESDWKIESSNKYSSKHLIIDDEEFLLKIPTGYSNSNLKILRKELGINYFHFLYLLRYVKKSCKLADKRKRDEEISYNWKKFLEKNKDLNRDNKINQIID